MATTYKPASRIVEKSIDEHNDFPLTIEPRPAYQRQKANACISFKTRVVTQCAS